MKTQNMSKKTKSRYSREVAYQPLFLCKISHKCEGKKWVPCSIFCGGYGDKKSKIFLSHFNLELRLGSFYYGSFTFWTGSRSMLPFDAKSLFGCLQLMQHKKLEKNKKTSLHSITRFSIIIFWIYYSIIQNI